MQLSYKSTQQGSLGGCFWMLLFILLAAHQHVCFVHSVLFESSVVCSYSSCYSPESGITISENDVKAEPLNCKVNFKTNIASKETLLYSHW